uniref:Rad21_Rec8_N domain-containing protein n=1 Tax=Parastrongyloides trichosuri TaxID=131310 RepID=A0A0N4ZHF4_PARTI
MNCSSSLLNTCEHEENTNSPTSTTPIRRPLLMKSNDKPKNVGLTDIVTALDILMVAVREQFTNFRARLQQIDVSRIVIIAARRLRGVFFQRFYIFFMGLLRRTNIYDDITARNTLKNDNKEEVVCNEYLGETLNDISDIMLVDLFPFDGVTVHKFQVNGLKINNDKSDIFQRKNDKCEDNRSKNGYDFDEKYSLQSGETGQESHITETEAFKKINEMESEIMRLKEEMKKIMGLSTVQYNKDNKSNVEKYNQRSCSSLDDGISVTSTQTSPMISPKANDNTPTFMPPPPPPLPSLINSKVKKENKSIEAKCVKKSQDVPTAETNDGKVVKMNSNILLSELQSVKLKKVDVERIKTCKKMRKVSPSECNDAGSFLQHALFEKFKNVKAESLSDTDSEISVWSDDDDENKLECQYL